MTREAALDSLLDHLGWQVDGVYGGGLDEVGLVLFVNPDASVALPAEWEGYTVSVLLSGKPEVE